MKQEKHRSDWDDNHLIISEAYFNLVNDNKKRPSLKLLAAKTDLSIQTIHKHLNELTELSFGERFKSFKLLSEKVVLAMFNEAVEGNPSCAKLFFQVVDQFSEKHDLTVKDSTLRNMSEKELEAELEALRIKNRTKENINSDNDGEDKEK